MQEKTVIPAPMSRVRPKLVDNSMEIGGLMVLKEGGKYMRHLPSGRVYPFVEDGAKREDVEIFIHHAKGDQKINKPPKVKRPGPFSRGDAEKGAGWEGPASDNFQTVA